MNESILKKAQVVLETYDSLFDKRQELERALTDYLKGTTWVKTEKAEEGEVGQIIYFKVDKIVINTFDDDDIHISVYGVIVSYYPDPVSTISYGKNVSIEYGWELETLYSLLGKKPDYFYETKEVTIEEFNQAVNLVMERLQKLI